MKITCSAGTPRCAANSASNLRVRGPCPSQFSANTSRTASSSSSPRDGWKTLYMSGTSIAVGSAPAVLRGQPLQYRDDVVGGRRRDAVLVDRSRTLLKGRFVEDPDELLLHLRDRNPD